MEPQEQAYDHVVKLAWDFITSKVPVESNGLKTYLTHSTFDPATLHGTDWPHHPAGLYAMFVDSALDYYSYSGDSVALDRVREVLDYQLQHGTTPAGWYWGNVPYASSDAGALEYFGADDVYYCGKEGRTPAACGVGDGHYVIEPDKVGELGLGYLKFFELTGEAKYRDAAMACGAAFAVALQGIRSHRRDTRGVRRRRHRAYKAFRRTVASSFWRRRQPSARAQARLGLDDVVPYEEQPLGSLFRGRLLRSRS